MKVGPPPAPLCDTCKNPLMENFQPTAPPKKWLPPDIEMVQDLFSVSEARALDALMPAPAKNPAEFADYRPDIMIALRLLAKKGPMLSGKLVKELEPRLRLTDGPIRKRLWSAHDANLINMDPPKSGHRIIKNPLPRPANLRHNAIWVSLTEAGLLVLLRYDMTRQLMVTDSMQRALTPYHIVDVDIDMQAVAASARQVFDTMIRVSDEELGRRPEVEPLD